MAPRGEAPPPGTDAHGQPVGAAVPDWRGARLPPRAPLVGRTCRLEPLVPSHAAPLFAALDGDAAAATYLGYAPFPSPAALEAFILAAAAGPDRFYAVEVADTPLGFAAFLRIQPAEGAIEIGSLYFSRGLRGTTAATEAVFLLLGHAVDDLGYRRVEWKCDALNARSRRAAERLGFAFEGVFRQALVVKGRNRDTAWYAMIDADWPARRARLAAWLDPANFDAAGRQIRALGTL